MHNNQVLTMIPVVILAVVCSFALFGCTGENIEARASNGKELGHDRFHIVEGSYGSEAILVDTETGVEYFWKHQGNVGGLTVLVDRDGKPLRAPGFKDLQ